VEGGLSPKALEDESGGSLGGKGGNCLNCGAVVTGN